VNKIIESATLMLSPGNLPAVLDAEDEQANFAVRNAEALSQATQAVISGNLSVVAQQMDLLISLMGQSAKAYAGIATELNPKESAKKYFHAVREAMQSATAASNILSEMSVRSNASAADIVQKRIYAALDEMQNFALKAIVDHPVFGTRT
jgi:phasin family protein